MSKISKTIYKVGDRVAVRHGAEHTKGAKVGIIEQIATPALGIRFDGESKVHKWYVDDEVEREFDLGGEG